MGLLPEPVPDAAARLEGSELPSAIETKNCSRKRA